MSAADRDTDRRVGLRLTGAGHLTLASLLPSQGDLLVVERQMAQARFPMPPSHSVADLMQGFSVTMSLLLVAWGVSVLLMTRQGRTPDRAQVGLSLALSLALLVTAVLLLPAPPIVLMTVASFRSSLRCARRRDSHTGGCRHVSRLSRRAARSAGGRTRCAAASARCRRSAPA